MSEEVKFEKAMERLEKIVEELESGNISLDEALKKYEEGVKLSRACQAKLTQAEKKIEILTKQLDGGFSKEPFDPEDMDEAKEKPAAAKRKPKTPSGDSDFEDKDLIL